MGKDVTLARLSFEHKNGLIDAVNDGEVFKTRYAQVPSPDEMEQEIKRRLDLLELGKMLPFTVIDNKSNKIIGMTSFANIEPVNRRLDIGWTWYSKSYQKSTINTESKYLLLNHAFEKLKMLAVGFRVDTLNLNSQRAVLRIGAKWEGTIRNYSILKDGNTRDMHFYSIILSEWPNIKAHITYLMSR